MMAISSSNILPLTARELQKAIDAIDSEMRHTWAVYYDFDHAHMKYEVRKIEPWSERTLSPEYYGTYKIVGAVDELDAYNKFMEQINK